MLSGSNPSQVGAARRSLDEDSLNKAKSLPSCSGVSVGEQPQFALVPSQPTTISNHERIPQYFIIVAWFSIVFTTIIIIYIIIMFISVRLWGLYGTFSERR